ncbi:MAG: murein transglycosylase A [Paracoccaceae bacterium]
MKIGGLATIIATCFAVIAANAETTRTVLSFDDLNGWENDNHAAALAAFRSTCGDLKKQHWPSICAVATSQPDPKVFFELLFRPVLIESGDPGLFTGYFEPELSGSMRRTLRYRYPIYSLPPEVKNGQLWHPREAIENQHILAGRGLEIAWVDNPVDVFFLQIQGSGRIRLPDGSIVRVGYGGSNGHNYHSIGKELVRQGVYQPHQVSAQVIRNWVLRNPAEGTALLQTNPSYVFFRKLNGLASDKGPLGAMNRSITAHRTLAVDPAFVPLGAPVWVEKGGSSSFRRLMIAQDTGSAIKGAQRGDIFFGSGFEAGRAAGRINDPGRMIVLLPIELAFSGIQDAER